LRLLQKDQNRAALYQEVQEEPAYKRLDQETGRMIAVLLRDDALQQYIEDQEEDGKETFNMCKALDDMRQEAIERGISEGMERGISEGMNQGMNRGRAVGEDLFARLTGSLLQDGRMDDLHRAVRDPDIRQDLYREYHMLS
ncbi:MAG: hypothetical protein LUC98_08775, partial [Lachnospiraceae bacterium]|nr:hypothetical protein [Lachnospiraceae bacterium]